jgi:hypothetical protein
LAAEAFVVDIPPEIDVVLGVRDMDNLAAPFCWLPRVVPAFDVDVEPVDAVEDAFGVIDDATHVGQSPCLETNDVTHRRRPSISW